ncbi:T9SS type A sorting domain-containing protein [Flavobacterium sufflavum]|uniref:T9SS type A sorting domain-containing protein n=1 Tax=Flavobacterium sufflavum TaxID=1921138 RepID=A0A437KPS4_9FLAO|nr:T9SS type A sorting domain-containing protein [Flavobacterium sufflavum]RVT73461.1 T9SS type A sorting domain-containing protein [Flavobacterium sufflavum]
MTQTLSFTVTNNNNSLFSVQPAIAANGTLSYTLAANANGTAAVTVALSDNGSNVSPNINTSAAQTFNINVTAVNDVPVFTKGADQTVNEDAPAQSIASWATGIDDGDPELTQTLSFTVTNNNNSLFSVQPAIAANGTLSYTLAANANGIAIVTVTLSDNGSNVSPNINTSAAQTFNINVTAVNDAPVVVNNAATQNVQYSDPISAVTISATDLDNVYNELTALTSWKKSTDIGFSPGLPNNLMLTETSVSGSPKTWSLTGNMMVSPGTYYLKVKVNDGTSNSANNWGETTIEIVVEKEDTRLTFTGTQLVATQSSSSGLATVQLRATVQDITATLDAAGDVNYGDIRNAKVRFLDGTTPIVVSGLTDAYGWVLSPIALVNPSDTKTGIVTLNWPVDIGSATDVEYTIGMEVSGYYIRNHQDDNTVITVYKSVGDFITGGGHIIPTQSAGQYASDAGKKTNFGFNVKFNKSNKNLQGNMNIIFRRTVAGVLRVYQIKANSMTSLGVNIANPNAQTAVFTSKCNLTDITNPQSPISLGGNLTLQVNMTDRGEPGSNDDIAISLYNGSILFYSSKWTGSNTGMTLLVGGNLVVRSGFSLGSVTAKEGLSKVELTEETVAQEASIGNKPTLFDVIAYPNPSNNQFTITLVGGSNEKVSVQVFDLLGKLIKVIEKNDGEPIVFGEELPLSVYVAIVTQGDNRKTIKLVKQ